MAKLLEEWKEDLVEALTEHDLLLGSKHKKIEHAVLLMLAAGRHLLSLHEEVANGGWPRWDYCGRSLGLHGALVGIGSLLLMGRLNSGVPGAGLSYEMDAITAVIVGGTSMSGGSGTLGGTLVGAIIVGIINNVQTLMGVDSNIQKIVKGVIIVGAVIIDVVTKNSAKKAR